MKYFTVILLLCCAGRSSGSFRFDLSFNSEKDVKFYHYSDQNNCHKLKFNSTIYSAWVNIEWKTVVFIHGWKKGHRVAEVVKNAYFLDGVPEVNLIEVDWSKGANNVLYSVSANRVPDVGETVAKFIGLNQKIFNSEKLSIVGHDLGAHVAGFAGKWLQSYYKFKPRLIIGLDPTGLHFRGNTKKLQPTDAQGVLVIHTSQKLGHLEPLGTLDVYVNGGKSQPGCTDAQSHDFSTLIYKELINGKKQYIVRPYSSFAEVTNDIIPNTVGKPLSHAAPVPPRHPLIYLEAKEYFDSK